MSKDYNIGLYNVMRNKLRTADDILNFLSAVETLNTTDEVTKKAEYLYNYLINNDALSNASLAALSENSAIKEALSTNNYKYSDLIKDNKGLNVAQKNALKNIYISGGLNLTNPDGQYQGDSKDLNINTLATNLSMMPILTSQTVTQLLKIVLGANAIQLFNSLKNDTYDELKIPTRIFESLNSGTLVGEDFLSFIDKLNNASSDLDFLNVFVEEIPLPEGITIDAILDNVKKVNDRKLLGNNYNIQNAIINSDIKIYKDQNLKYYINLPDDKRNKDIKGNNKKPGLLQADYDKIKQVLLKELTDINTNLASDVEGLVSAATILDTKIEYVDKSVKDILIIIKKGAAIIAKTNGLGDKLSAAFRQIPKSLNEKGEQNIVTFADKVNIIDYISNLFNNTNELDYTKLLDKKYLNDGNLNIKSVVNTLYQVLNYKDLTSTTGEGLLQLYTLINTNFI